MGTGRRTRYNRDNWRSLCDGVEISRDYSPELARQAAEIHAGGIGSLKWTNPLEPNGLPGFASIADHEGHMYRLEPLDMQATRPIAKAPDYDG